MDEPLEESVIGELLGLLAHDLRNPLSALHSNLGFLRSVLPEGDVDAKEAVDDGLVSCDGLAHIIDNIDLLGQALQRGGPTESSTLDLAIVADEAVRHIQAMARSHGVSLVLAPPSGPVPVKGSRDFLSRALSNLVRNAVQHSPAGSTVRVAVASRGAEGVATVTDPGSTLGAETRLLAFTAKGQIASKAVPNGRYSRGLGLYSAALAARAGNGRVSAVDPAAGAGNAFELVVPRGT
ncbi:MAG TPA: HAMP domain-containing sensor histidine kinase [Polyangiaceae bacterium]|nr:HAMP domain-containing sensor histidine kinase [Polyangiaceae bacterium]